MRNRRWIVGSTKQRLRFEHLEPRLLLTAVVSDDFSSGTLDPALWTLVNPLGDAVLQMTGAGTDDAVLEIQVPGGVAHDAWIVNEAPRIMQQAANTDFEIEVKFESPLTQVYQDQGVVVEQDSGNYLRFDLYSDGSGIHVFAASIANASATVKISNQVIVTQPMYLRVTRAGDEWLYSYSDDGANWMVAGNFVEPLVVEEVGVFAGNYPFGGNAPAHTAKVDYFFETSAPIIPEDGAVSTAPRVEVPIDDVAIPVNAPASVIDLFAAFNDAQDEDEALIYRVASNDNPGLFNSTVIDGVAGTLTLDYAADTSGMANLTIRATDTDGLFVDDTFRVSVNPIASGEGLVGHWKFDNKQSANVADDSSGNGNHGVIQGPTFVSGQVDSALDFDGVDDYVDLGGLDVNGTGLTIAAWIRADSFVGTYQDGRIVSKATGTQTQNHYWMLSTIRQGSDTRLRFRLKTEGQTDTLIAGSGNLSMGRWYHAAAVYDGSLMRLYVDGVEVGRLAKTGTVDVNAAVAAWIGRNPSYTQPFDGLIDEMRIYDRGLSPQEIQAMVNPVPSGEGLVGHWEFDNKQSANVADDSSGNGNHGAIQGPTFVSGQVGSALDFDGVDDYVDLGGLDVNGTGLTIAAWIRANSFVGTYQDGRIVSKATGAQAQDHYWMLSTIHHGSDPRLRFRLKTEGQTDTLVASSGNLSTGRWYHAAAVYDGSLMRLHVDGVEVGCLAKTGTVDVDAAVAAWIGRNPSGTQPFDGLIDDVRIYDRGLSPQEIRDLNGNSTAPRVATPIGDVAVPVNATATVIDLFAAFDDAQDADDALVYRVESNDNPGLFDSTVIDGIAGTLTLDYAADTSGTANLTIRATDTDGLYVDDMFQVIVNQSEAPVIDVWYGSDQIFGQMGTPQTWANILGNVSDSDGVAALSYTLNGRPETGLNMGPDGRRLESLGDFNVDIAVDDLAPGQNQIVITAVDTLNNVSAETVNLFYSAGSVWPETYTVDWSTVTNLQDVAQVVDGQWNVTGNSVTTATPGYDRLLAIGDVAWDDYEVSVPITIHAPDLDNPHNACSCNAIGMGLRWQGHSVWDSAQPAWGYFPFGALALYRWDGNGRNERLWMAGNGYVSFANDASGKTLEHGVTYIFKARVETTSRIGGSLYSFKVWQAGDLEPSIWDLTLRTGAEDLPAGSILLLSHYVDATFGTVTITPYTSSGLALSSPNGVMNTESSVETLTPEAAIPVVDYAIAQWAASDLPNAPLEALDQIEVRVADLEGSLLGQATPTSITLDANAARHGWFVDPTPEFSDEFIGNGTLTAVDGGPAADRVDLLTVVMHELGHVLGYSHQKPQSDTDHLMHETLATGVRKELEIDILDTMFAEFTSALSTVTLKVLLRKT